MLMPKLRVSCLNVLVMNVESVDVSMRSKKEVIGHVASNVLISHLMFHCQSSLGSVHQ